LIATEAQRHSAHSDCGGDGHHLQRTSHSAAPPKV
jgi:hypothetical protein